LTNFRLLEIDSPNLVVSAIKISDRDPFLHVLRLYEDRGESTVAKVFFNFDHKVAAVHLMNSIEKPIEGGDQVFTFD
jgi:alpha-mannosidase